eukprot:1717973-Lingulodinium_polyedra.AAC.1
MLARPDAVPAGRGVGRVAVRRGPRAEDLEAPGDGQGPELPHAGVEAPRRGPPFGHGAGRGCRVDWAHDSAAVLAGAPQPVLDAPHDGGTLLQ